MSGCTFTHHKQVAVEEASLDAIQGCPRESYGALTLITSELRGEYWTSGHSRRDNLIHELTPLLVLARLIHTV